MLLIWSFPANHSLFEVSYWSTRTRCENCSLLRIKTQERCQWHCSGVLIVNCELLTRCSVFLQILLAGKLIRSYLNVDTNAFKDTHSEKSPSSKIPALTKSMNMDIWVVGKLKQLFIRGSLSEIIFSTKRSSYWQNSILCVRSNLYSLFYLP